MCDRNKSDDENDVYLSKQIVMETKALIHKFQDLPDSAKKQLLDFLDFLTAKYGSAKNDNKENFSFDWAGGLEELDASSVDLQHKANQWR